MHQERGYCPRQLVQKLTGPTNKSSRHVFSEKTFVKTAGLVGSTFIKRFSGTELAIKVNLLCGVLYPTFNRLPGVT